MNQREDAELGEETFCGTEQTGPLPPTGATHEKRPTGTDMTSHCPGPPPPRRVRLDSEAEVPAEGANKWRSLAVHTVLEGEAERCTSVSATVRVKGTRSKSLPLLGARYALLQARYLDYVIQPPEQDVMEVLL